jgi:hypothetical protein
MAIEITWLKLQSNRVIQKVCLEEEIEGKFHQNWD